MFNPNDFVTPVWAFQAERSDVAVPVAAGETVDLLVVGGGFQGLTAALHAAREGRSVRLIEARRIGEGASGLNGGQVIPGLKYDPEALIAHFGEAAGEKAIAFSESTADAVFDLIAAENLSVPGARRGWVQACHTDAALAAAADRHRQWAARGADVAMLDRAEISRLLGTGNYVGGFFDRRAGVVNPLALVYELARVANEAGVRIAENEPCAGLRKTGDGWIATTRAGVEIRAGAVIVATNAYTDRLLPEIGRSLVALHSFQIATAPLPARLAGEILPEGQAVSDSRRILVYYRRTADGRLVLGGRGRMTPPRHTRDWAHLERAMVRLFPALSGIGIERRWFGRVGVTPDHMPHIHEPEPGLIASAGCQGRGVGLMVALGNRLAAYALRRDPAVLPWPVVPVRPIPMHRFRRIGVGATVTWMRMRDALER